MSEYVAHRTRCGARTGSARRGRSVVGDAAGALAKHVVDACADRPLGLDASRAEVDQVVRSEEHTSELQSLMRISYAVFCLKKKKIANREKETSRIQNKEN